MSSGSPAGAQPPLPTPEYLAESLAPTIRGVLWTSVVVPLVFVLLRCYARYMVRKVFALDDWFILLAMALLICYGAVIEAALVKGLGRHVEWVVLEVPQNAIPIALLGQVSQPLVIMSCAFGKVSISITLLRVGTARWMKIAVWFVMVSMMCLHVVVSILLFFRCDDPRVLWDPSVKTTCWPTYVYLYVMYFIGAYSAATDYVLALLPWAVLWKLNMKKKEKFGVAIAMSLGLIAGSIAIAKTTKLGANSTSTDPTYDVGVLLWWAGAENGLIVIAACLPTLRPMLRHFFNSTIRSSERSHRLKDLSNPNENSRSKMSYRDKSAGGGTWTAIVETEIHGDQTSDNNSDKSILKGHGAGAERGASRV